MVLLQPQGPKVCDGTADEPGYGVRLLEGYRKGSGGGTARGIGGDEEDLGFLPREGSQGEEDGVGDA